MTVFRDSRSEIDELLAAERERQAADLRVSNLSPEDARVLVADVVDYARTYPDLDAGVAYELASNGVRASDPLARDVAYESSEDQALRQQVPSGAISHIDSLIAHQDQRSAIKPYEDLLRIANSAYDEDDFAAQEAHLDQISRLPRSYAEQILASHRDGEFENDGQVILAVGDALADEYGNDWRNVLVQMSAEEQKTRDKALLQAHLADPSAATDAVRQAATDAQPQGGLRGFVGSITRPTIAALSAGPQYVTNRFRQSVGDAVGGLQTASSQATFGGSTGLTQGSSIMNPTGLTPASQGSVRSAGGLANAATDALSLAAPGGIGARAGLTALPDVIEVANSREITPGIAEAAAATDLAVFAEDPSSAGDGLLLSEDLIRERQRRESALAPTFENGELITFGRAFAAGAGFDLDSRGYNTLSGAVDFWVALGGPGEAGAEGAVALARGGRTLPGVRAIPGIGKFDPLIEAGGLPSKRSNYVLRPTAEQWLDSWRGRSIGDALSKMDSTDDVMRAFNGKISVYTAREIAETSSGTGVLDILKSEIGISVRSTPTLGASSVPGFRATLRGSTTATARFTQQSRLLSRLTDDLPQVEDLDVYNLDETYRWASSHLANASVPRAEAKAILDDLSATTYSERLPFILNRIANPIFESTFESAVKRNMNSILGKSKLKAAENFGSPEDLARVQAEMTEAAAERAQRLTRHFSERVEGLMLYHIDQAGMPGANPLATITDDGLASIASPHLIVEQLHSKLPVPGVSDLRELRRINAPLYDLLSRPLLREASALATGSRSILEAATMVWKPLALLRAAYVMRVVGEEQLRIAAAGGDSIVNNPMGWFAWVMSRGKRSLDMNGENIRETTEFMATRLGSGRKINPADVFKHAKEKQIARSQVYARVARGEVGFDKAWGGELSQLSTDPLAKFVADAGGVTDDVVDDALEQFSKELESVANRSTGSSFQRGWSTDQRAATREYLSSIDQRIRAKTGENAELREAIARGKIVRGESEIKLAGDVESALVANEDFVRILSEEFTGFSPDQVKGVRTVSASQDFASQFGDAKALASTFLDVMGGAIIEKPTSFLSRSPAFLQSYWEFAGNNAALLRRADAPKLRRMLDAKATDPSRLDGARDFLTRIGLDPDRAINAKVNDIASQAAGTLTLKEFDLLAKGHAMDATNDLLFNLTTRQQWADSARIIAPFATAWAEVVTRWGGIISRNPNIPRRVQQMSTVMKEDDLAETLDQWGAQTISGEGLIYTDDFGQEVVVVPWIRNEQPMSIPLSQLSVGASFLPGLGPAAAIPLNWLMPDAWKRKEAGPLGEVGELLFPFGEPSDDVFDPSAMVAEFVPSWVRYALRAGTGNEPGDFATQEDVDSYNGRVIAAGQWLLANDREGKYDVSNPDGWLDLMQDAKGEVRDIGLWQAISAYFGPGPARPNFFVEDADGNVQLNVDDPNSGTFISTITMANLYRTQREIALEAGFDGDEAEQIAFARTFEITNASNIRAATIGRSRSLIPGGVPLTESAFRWLQDNPDAPDRADLTWGYFAPQDDEDFYYPLYLEEINLGDRERLSFDQWAQSGQDALADAIYRDAADAVEERFPDGAPDEAKVILSDLRTDLRTRFPGWQEGIVATRGGATGAALELGRVTAEGGMFADHEFAPAIREVVNLREQTVDYLKANGISEAEVPFASSQASQPYRQWYAEKLDEFSEQYPEINHIIDEVFRREIRAGLYVDAEREESGD